MKYVDELIERAKGNNKGGKYWVELYKDIMNFLDGDYPEEDKKKLRQKGRLEKVGMLYEGYKDEIKNKALKEKNVNKLVGLIEEYNLQDDEKIIEHLKK